MEQTYRLHVLKFDLSFLFHRDGVLLCHLAIRLDPESIDMKAVNLRPQMAQFLCLKNIRLFLKACSTSFGIKVRVL